MTVERIVAELDHNARAEAAEIIRAAKQKAVALAKAAEEEAAAARQAILTRSDRDAEGARQRILTAARLRARAIMAGARHEAVDKALAQARQALADMPREQYRSLLLDALVNVAEGTEAVVLSPRDREQLGPWLVQEANARLQGNLSLAEQTRPLTGGFVLLAGPVEVNVSLDVLLQRLRDDLEPEVASVLFGQEG